MKGEGNRGVRRVLWTAGLALALAPASPALASPATPPLSPAERSALVHGGVVKRDFKFERDGAELLAVLTYIVVEAPPEEIMAVLEDSSTYPAILPGNREAKLVGREKNDQWVTLRHGSALASAAFTVRIRKESPRLMRFWLDPDFPHEVEDAWGFFRLDPVPGGKTLLSYGAAIEISGVAKLLFEGKIRAIAQRTPEHVRNFVNQKNAERRLARPPAPSAPVPDKPALEKRPPPLAPRPAAVSVALPRP